MSLYTNVCPGRPYTSSHFVILLSVHFVVVLPITRCDSQYKQLPLYKIAVIVFCSCHNLLLLSVFRCHSPALAYNAIVNGLYHWHTLSPYYPTVWHSIEIFPQINLSWHFLEPQISLSANCCQSHLNHQWFSLAVNSGADQWFKVKVLICSNWLTRKGSFTGFLKHPNFLLFLKIAQNDCWN